jgi:23S rRNA U2552 (ribose-2'-O)-methylase RlmE/FtsJ
MADEIEWVAIDLNREHARAARRMERVMSNHELSLIEEGEGVPAELNESSGSESSMDATNDAALALAELKNSDRVVSLQSQVSLQSHEDFMKSLSSTHTLLLDMAAALRAVTQKEAQELGEVALEVARMFVWSLGKVHCNMIQMTLSNDPQGRVSNDFHIIPAMEGESSRDEPTERTVATIVGGTAKRKGGTWGGVDTCRPYHLLRAQRCFPLPHFTLPHRPPVAASGQT